MFSTCSDGSPELRAGLHVADGEMFEIRYVDPAEAASWASERGFLFSLDDVPPAVVAYFD
jgi:hypothetical protein